MMTYELMEDYNEQSEDLTNIKLYPNWPFKLLNIYLSGFTFCGALRLTSACPFLKFEWLNRNYSVRGSIYKYALIIRRQCLWFLPGSSTE